MLSAAVTAQGIENGTKSVFFLKRFKACVRALKSRKDYAKHPGFKTEAGDLSDLYRHIYYSNSGKKIEYDFWEDGRISGSGDLLNLFLKILKVGSGRMNRGR
jgi:hypothetical protein